MKKIFFLIYLLFEVILLSNLLLFCYKSEMFSFQEGEYSYNSEKIDIYQDISVERVSLFFGLVNSYSTDKSKKENIIINRKDKKSYYIDIVLKIKDINELYHCKLDVLPKIGDQTDIYYVNIDISNIVLNYSVILSSKLVFYYKSYDEGLTNQSADEIYLYIMR